MIASSYLTSLLNLLSLPQHEKKADKCLSLSSTPYTLSSNLTATFVFESGRSKGRSFRLHLPSGYNEQSEFPTVLSFHGKGDSDVWQEHITQLSESDLRIDGKEIIAVYPQGSKSSDGSGELSWAGAPYSSTTSDDVSSTYSILGGD
jgi:poly(3-hydroxybutyrate) depolymerase